MKYKVLKVNIKIPVVRHKAISSYAYIHIPKTGGSLKITIPKIETRLPVYKMSLPKYKALVFKSAKIKPFRLKHIKFSFFKKPKIIHPQRVRQFRIKALWGIKTKGGQYIKKEMERVITTRRYKVDEGELLQEGYFKIQEKLRQYITRGTQTKLYQVWMPSKNLYYGV